MKSLYIEASTETPRVNFNAESGYFKIQGNSTSANVERVYNDVITWVGNYVEQPCMTTQLDLQLNSLNITSSKKILRIIRKLNRVCNEGNSLTVNWITSPGDSEMIELGKDYDGITDAKFCFLTTDEIIPHAMVV